MRKILIGALVALATAGLVGCSASGGSSDSGGGGGGASAITISGSINTASAQAFSAFSNDPFAISASDLQLYGIGFSNPPVISTVDVNADGTFSLSLAVADNTPISLIFKTKADGAEVGVVKFEDSTKKDMAGNNKKSTSIPLSGAISLGALNLSGGEVTVPVTQITSTSGGTAVGNTDVDAGTAFDMGGVWLLTQYSGTLPTGYTDPFAAGSCGHPQDPNESCIPSGAGGFPLQMIRFVGSEFTPNGSCVSESNCPETAGTIGGVKYGLSLWEGAPGSQMGDAFADCGSKSGFTADEARFGGNIHIPAANVPAGVTMGDYVFPVRNGWGGDASPYDQWWMKTGATTNWPMPDCTTIKRTQDSKDYFFNVCSVTVDVDLNDNQNTSDGGETGLTRYEVHPSNGGGCFNSATNAPVMTDHTFWQSNPNPTGCTESNVTIGGLAMRGHECNYTNVSPNSAVQNINMTCKFMGAQFEDAALTTAETHMWGGNRQHGMILDPQNAAKNECREAGSGTDAQKIAAMRCYSNAFHMSWWDGQDKPACSRDLRFNWAATDPANFVMTDYRQKPKGQIVTNVVTYAPNGQAWSVEDTQTEIATIFQNDGTSSREIACRFSRTEKISGTVTSSTTMTMEVVQSALLIDRDPGCLAAVKAAQAGETVNGSGDLKHLAKNQRWMFTATKQ